MNTAFGIKDVPAVIWRARELYQPGKVGYQSVASALSAEVGRAITWPTVRNWVKGITRKNEVAPINDCAARTAPARKKCAGATAPEASLL